MLWGIIVAAAAVGVFTLAWRRVARTLAEHDRLEHPPSKKPHDRPWERF